MENEEGKAACGHEECGRCCKRKWKHRGYHHHTLGGGIWFIGWLFTIGYLKLTFLWGVLALVLWPYLMGVHFAG